MEIENLILQNLIINEEFSRKALPYLKSEYFLNIPDKTIFKLISDHFIKYNRLPNFETLNIDLQSIDDLNENVFEHTKNTIKSLRNIEEVQFDWLVDNTEKFCQDRAIHNALSECISITHGNSDRGRGSIPQILSDALAVSFDTHMGHDFLADWEFRYDNYRKIENRISFDLEYFNKITHGGLINKTLTVILAGTGSGKSRFMAHCAANNLRDGKNVLYITLEMSEYSIAERVDANLLNVDIDKLKILNKETYEKKINDLRNRTPGTFLFKEYPTATASAMNFKHLLNELKLKKKFVPDIVYVDYINICTSHRFKNAGGVGSYFYIKSIAEELRGLAVEFDIPIVTATQLNRDGFAASDVGLENTAESFGLPATADLMFALIATDEFSEMGQIQVKQLKNRYNDPSYYRRFVIGVDNKRMRHYDVEPSAQENIMDGPINDTAVMDKTNFGIDLMDDLKLAKNKFKRFKF